MALTANKISSGPIVTNRTAICRSHEKNCVFVSTRINRIQPSRHRLEHGHLKNGCLLEERSTLSNDWFWFTNRKPVSLTSKKSSISCKSTGANNTEEKELIATYDDVSDLTSGIMSLDARARQDVALLGTEFLKLDARAREDTEKIDRGVKEKAGRLNRIATILKDIAKSRLKSAADEHWSDGALEADLRLADFRAKQRAMEDALMALELIINIHDRMVSKMYNFPLRIVKGSLSENNVRGQIMLEKNGKATDSFPGDVTTERITALQEAYWSMASALSEADGIDYTDPEELELLITTLIDLDAMDGKQSVSLLAECSSSPDVSTRRALANALAAAPSMWTLGNAGMGALQRLAEDSNPAIAAAASKAIYELKKQWEIEEGDSWRFMMGANTEEEKERREYDNEEDTK
ncbi:senescence-associated protein AAF, chlorolplastic isoform X2 [Lotus japonicus]|uniref:senescence-associated protein AAF, chlorolplastic isoform X2 n=1 Tax=Lotus japonicus TaxID=34305 RepID=UPI0025863D48|nr:senescence-associated protein AAF, chlorolplastic isoform X2 [Lotus japonicus]